MEAPLKQAEATEHENFSFRPASLAGDPTVTAINILTLVFPLMSYPNRDL